MYARRRFVLVQFVVCVLATGRTGHAQDPQPGVAKSLRIGLLTPVGSNPEALSVERGVRLGAEEAKQTANLFGNDVQLYEASTGTDAAAAALRLLSGRQVQVIIGASAADAPALSEFAERHHLLFINAASRAQGLRAACRRYTFHVAASEAMYSNAAAMRASGTSLRALTGAGDAGDSIALWTSTLERYGAAQINDRYRGRFHAGMDGEAWAGWFAVKVASESALRAGSAEPARLLVYLESPGTSFDGHKGWPLSFRIAEHQLRQPLYVIMRSGKSAAAEKTRDVPELRDASSPGTGEPARLNHALDRLIASPTVPRCQWTR